MKKPLVTVRDGKIKKFAAWDEVADLSPSAPAGAVVYELLHEYNEDDPDNVKSLGLYSSMAAAEAAQAYAVKRAGFRRYPNAFKIQERRLDLLAWSEGFITV